VTTRHAHVEPTRSFGVSRSFLHSGSHSPHNGKQNWKPDRLPATRTLLATMVASATGSAAASTPAVAAAFPGFVVPVASSPSLSASGCDASGVSARSAQAIVHTFLMILHHSETVKKVILLHGKNPTRTTSSSRSLCACRR